MLTQKQFEKPKLWHAQTSMADTSSMAAVLPPRDGTPMPPSRDGGPEAQAQEPPSRPSQSEVLELLAQLDEADEVFLRMELENHELEV